MWFSSIPGEPEKEGWGSGPTRAKPSAPLGPGRSSDAEPEAAEAGLDLRAGMADIYKFMNKMYYCFVVFISW